MSALKSISKCKKHLLVTWLIGAGISAILLIGQTMGNGWFDGHEGDVWGWFVPHVAPTISLMLGAKYLMNVADENKTVDSFIYLLNIGLSIAYFLVLILSILLLPTYCTDCDSPHLLLLKSNYWLAPMQVIVTAALGNFVKEAEQNTKIPAE